MNCDSVQQNASVCNLHALHRKKTSLPGAPSSARILRLRWGCATRPSQLLHVPFCPKRMIAIRPKPLTVFPPTQNRHFDRSCSRSYREQRSGEIRFSTSPFPSHHRALVLAFASSPPPATNAPLPPPSRILLWVG